MAAVTAGGASGPLTFEEFGNLLSPSQVACFTDCSARWYFKYALHLPDPKNANLALGIAVHEAIAWQLTHGMETGFLPDAWDVAEEFGALWRDELERETILRDEDDPKEIEATGRALVARYAAEVSPLIEPAAIEEHVAGTIGGVKVQGKVDIRQKDGLIRDIKTAARKPNGVSAQHAFQLATYAQITPNVPDRAILLVDTLVKTKTPQLYAHAYQVSESDVQQVERMYPLVQEAIRNELYVPNRASTLCGRKHCAFWRACEREFGGRVSE